MLPNYLLTAVWGGDACASCDRACDLALALHKVLVDAAAGDMQLAKSRDDKGLWPPAPPAMPYQTSVPRAGHMVNPCIKAHATASPKTLSRTAGFDRKAIRVCQEHARTLSVT